MRLPPGTWPEKGEIPRNEGVKTLDGPIKSICARAERLHLKTEILQHVPDRVIQTILSRPQNVGRRTVTFDEMTQGSPDF